MKPVPTVVYDHHIFGQQAFGGISRYVCEIAGRINGARCRTRIVAPVHFNEYLAGYRGRHIGCYIPKLFPRAGPLYRAVNTALWPLAISLDPPDLVHLTYY